MALHSYNIAKGWRLWIQLGIRDWLDKSWVTKWAYIQLQTPRRSFKLEWLPGQNGVGYWSGECLDCRS